jgi:hypothetical protein
MGPPGLKMGGPDRPPHGGHPVAALFGEPGITARSTTRPRDPSHFEQEGYLGKSPSQPVNPQ